MKKQHRARFATLAAVVAAFCGSVGMNNAFGAETLKTFYVATNGNDAWSGQSADASANDGPFATLERARAAVKEYKKTLNADAQGDIVVSVAAGKYELKGSLELTAEDGGTDAVAVRWVSDVNAPAVLVGGRYLSGAKKLSDADVLNKLKPEARDHVVEFDLAAQGSPDLGAPNNAPELFFQGEPARVSRFPNDGFVKIVDVVKEGTTEVDDRGVKGVKEGKFTFAEDELTTWEDEQDVWVDGYWFWDWSNDKQRVVSIDAATKTITLAEPNHQYGYRPGQWFYAFNVLRELDSPGEYYIDRKNNKLYFYPTTDDWQDGDFLLSQTPSILALNGVKNFELVGFDLLGSRGAAVYGAGLDGVKFSELNVSNCGGAGIYIDNSYNCVVSCCELWNLGANGVAISGGDRATLTRGNNEIVENYIHDYARIQRMYAPGATIGGVGNRVAHCLVEDAPHMGMGFGGNDQLIEYNEIARVCTESNDAGAIYTGRNWSMRGHVLRGNFLHDIRGFQNNGCVGIYLDDMFSSATIEGNLFLNVAEATVVGGGRDNHITDNVFINCHPAVYVDARALGWAEAGADAWLEEVRTKGTVSGIKYNEEPFKSRYPEFATMFDEGKTPKAPEGTTVTGNVCIGGEWALKKGGLWPGQSLEPAALKYIVVKDNYVADSDTEPDGIDPGFVDPANDNYRLKPDSALIAKGFKSLSSEEFGLTNERMKAKAAVVHAKKNVK